MKLFWILVILVVCVLAVDARPDRTRLRELSDKLSGFKNMQGKMKGEKPSSGTQKPDKPDSDSIQSAGFSFSLPNLPVPDIPNIECADQMPIVLQMLSAITGQDRCKDVQCTKRGKITLSAPNYINAYCQCILCGGAKCVQYLAACSNHKCENGGSCIATPGSCTEHTCQCPGCYSGTYCSVLEDGCKLNPCNNGICTPVPGSCTEYTCPQCQECYSGANCETLEDPCENHQCQNGGACVPVPGSCTDYTCQCAGCYSGSECRTLEDPCQNNPCQHNGRCEQWRMEISCDLYMCHCTGCYSGNNCEIVANPCSQTNACYNGGACIPVPGSCAEYSCQCPRCYSGTQCAMRDDPCRHSPCHNNGICTPVPGFGSCTEYTCQCQECYTGTNCETTQTCQHNPCINNGICTAGSDSGCPGYTCLCPGCYSGNKCQEDTSSCTGCNWGGYSCDGRWCKIYCAYQYGPDPISNPNWHSCVAGTSLSSHDMYETVINTCLSNTCKYHNDGKCDDGRPGSVSSACWFSTDCEDCQGLPYIYKCWNSCGYQYFTRNNCHSTVINQSNLCAYHFSQLVSSRFV